MKKLLLLSALLIFACSSDDGSYNECTYEPTLQANEVTDITLTSAVLNGSVSIVSQYCDPYYTEQGFVYSTQSNPTLDDNSLVLQGANISTLIENLEPATTYYARVFLTNALGTWYGNEISFDTYAFENCNGDLVSTIVYGTQRWTVENACFTTYRDGTPIGDFNFTGAPIGHYVSNPSDPSGGILYNQYAISGFSFYGGVYELREFAPDGWHVPTVSEWITLREYLVSNGYTAESYSLAKSLASNSGWNTNSNPLSPGYNQSSNNISGFNAKPIGFFNVSQFVGIGQCAFFSSSTQGVAIGISDGSNLSFGNIGDLNAIGTEMSDSAFINAGLGDINTSIPYYYFPVRLVKD